MATKIATIPHAEGLYALTLKDGANVRTEPKVSASKIAFVSPNVEVGRLTGRGAKLDNGEIWVEVKLHSGKTGWAWKPLFALKGESSITTDQVQKELNQVLAIDKQTVEMGLNIFKKIQVLKKSGVDTSAVEARGAKVFRSLLTRHNNLQNSTAIKVKTWGETVIKSIKSFLGLAGIGDGGISAGAALVLAGVVAVASVSVYLLISAATAQSKVDYVETKAIKDILDKYGVSAEDKEILKEEVQKQLDDAYKTGANKEKWKSWQTVGLVLGGGFLAIKLMQFAQGNSAPRAAAA